MEGVSAARSRAGHTYGAVAVGTLYQRSGQVLPSSAGMPTYVTDRVPRPPPPNRWHPERQSYAATSPGVEVHAREVQLMPGERDPGRANVSREQPAEAASYSPDTIKSMEQGVRMPTPRVLEVADELCRAEGMLSAAQEYLRREKFPARAQDFMEREREAISLWWYEDTLVPGLLQTEHYARTLIENRNPPLDEVTIEEEQINRLLGVSRLRNVALQVLTFERAVPAGLLGSTVLLETQAYERFAFAEGPIASELSAEPGGSTACRSGLA